MVFNPKCEFTSPAALDRDFVTIHERGDNVLYSRKSQP